MSEEQFSLWEAEGEATRSVRALDVVESESSSCRTCGGQATLRDYRTGKPRDYCEKCLPLAYGQLPAGY